MYNNLPSLVLPFLTTISVIASVQIDSEINGFIISPLASIIPSLKPLNKTSSDSCALKTLFNNVLKGLPITS